MPLTWNAEDCPAMQEAWATPPEVRGEDVDGKWEILFLQLDEMIWATMATKIGSITESRVEEMAERLLILMRIGDWSPVAYEKDPTAEGKDRWYQKGEIPPPEMVLERVRGFVGLNVNVVNESRAAFWKSIRREQDRSAHQSIVAASKKLDEKMANA